MPQTKTCVWVIRPRSPTNPDGVHCNRPTRYRMIEDDDGFKRREYSPFCEHHAKLAAEQPDD